MNGVVEFAVVDDGVGPGADRRPDGTPGFGRMGLQERAALLGGTVRFEAASPAGGGALRVTLPLDEDEASA